MNKESIKSLLISYGYEIKDYNSYFTCNAKFRGGDDIGSIVVYPEKAIDYVLGVHYTIPDFLAVVTGAKSYEEVNSILNEKNIIIEQNPEPKIKQIKKFDKNLLLHLEKDHSYPISRGISEETLIKIFKESDTALKLQPLKYFLLSISVGISFLVIHFTDEQKDYELNQSGFFALGVILLFISCAFYIYYRIIRKKL